jgi:outer membrane immunogenic protein
MRLYQIKIVLLTALCMLANPASLKADICCDDLCCDQCACCWQGFYLNGQIGGIWTKHKYHFTNANYFNTLGPVVLGSRFDFKNDSFIGGGGAGYNYQCGCWVLGVEGGVFATNLKKSRSSPWFPDTDTYSAKLDWLANAKVRLGYAFNCFLPYISGGWAGANAKLRLRDSFAGISAKSEKWTNGWTIGAGADYMFCNCFSIGLGYDYIRLNHKRTVSCSNCGSGPGFGTPRVKGHVDIQTFVLRLNYHLNFF